MVSRYSRQALVGHQYLHYFICILYPPYLPLNVGLKYLGTLFRFVIKVAFKLVKKRIISEVILEKLADSLEKIELSFALYTKINSRWIKGLNVKKESWKELEDNIDTYLTSK